MLKSASAVSFLRRIARFVRAPALFFALALGMPVAAVADTVGGGGVQAPDNPVLLGYQTLAGNQIRVFWEKPAVEGTGRYTHYEIRWQNWNFDATNTAALTNDVLGGNRGRAGKRFFGAHLVPISWENDKKGQGEGVVIPRIDPPGAVYTFTASDLGSTTHWRFDLRAVTSNSIDEDADVALAPLNSEAIRSRWNFFAIHGDAPGVPSNVRLASVPGGFSVTFNTPCTIAAPGCSAHSAARYEIQYFAIHPDDDPENFTGTNFHKEDAPIGPQTNHEIFGVPEWNPQFDWVTIHRVSGSNVTAATVSTPLEITRLQSSAVVDGRSDTQLFVRDRTNLANRLTRDYTPEYVRRTVAGDPGFIYPSGHNGENLIPGQRYAVRVRAVNAGGRAGFWSPPVSVVAGDAEALSARPGEPQNFFAEAASGGFYFTWEPPKVEPANPIKWYLMYYGDETGQTNVRPIRPDQFRGVVTGDQNTGLKLGSTQTVRLAAYTGDMTEAQLRSTAGTDVNAGTALAGNDTSPFASQVVTLGAPATPANLQVFGGNNYFRAVFDETHPVVVFEGGLATPDVVGYSLRWRLCCSSPGTLGTGRAWSAPSDFAIGPDNTPRDLTVTGLTAGRMNEVQVASYNKIKNVTVRSKWSESKVVLIGTTNDRLGSIGMEVSDLADNGRDVVDLEPPFNPIDTAYTAVVPYTAGRDSRLFNKARVFSSHESEFGQLRVRYTNAQGMVVDSGIVFETYAAELPLNVGVNSYTFTAIAPNGLDEKDYTVLVTRLADVATLGVTPGALMPMPENLLPPRVYGSPAPEFLPGFNRYTVNVPATASAITVNTSLRTANRASIGLRDEAKQPMATRGEYCSAPFRCTLPLVTGAVNNIEIDYEHDGEGGGIAPYFIDVTRARGLDALTVTGGTLSPAFHANISEYSIFVSPALPEVLVTPRFTTTTENPVTLDITHATNIDILNAQSGDAQTLVPATLGNSQYIFRVTDGDVQTDYTVTLRTPPNVTALAIDDVLFVADPAADPVDASGNLVQFSPTTLSYNAVVQGSIARTRVRTRFDTGVSVVVTKGGVSGDSITQSGAPSQDIVIDSAVVPVTVTASKDQSSISYVVVVHRTEDAPSAPRNVRVAGGQTSLGVSWLAPESDGNSPLLSYAVRWKNTTTESAYPTANLAILPDTAGVYKIDSGLSTQNNLQHDVQVAALNVIGQSPWSAVVQGSINADFGPTDGVPNQLLRVGQTISAANQPVFPDANQPAGVTSATQYSIRSTAAGRAEATLPNGLAFDKTARTFSGSVADADKGDGIFTFLYRAASGDGSKTVDTEFNIIVSEPPTVTPPQPFAYDTTADTFYSAQLPLATGGLAPYSYAVSGTLPPGLEFDGNPSQRLLSGTPTDASTAAYRLQYVAHDAFGPVSGVEFTINVAAGKPGMPTNIRTTSASGQVQVNWDAPVNTGGRDIKQYTLKWKLASETNFATGGAVTPLASLFTGATTPNALATSLTDDEIYDFQLSATNAADVVGDFVAFQAAPGSPPNQVNNANITVTSGAGSLQVVWMPPDSNTATIASYQLRWRENVNPSYAPDDLASVAATTLTYEITGLQNGVLHAVNVRAATANGVGGAWSELVQGTPATHPGEPELTSVTPLNAGLQLEWSEPGNGGATIATYRVRWRDASSGQLVAAEWLPSDEGMVATTYEGDISDNSGSIGRSYTVTGLTNNTPYQVQVAADNANDQGMFGIARTATPRGFYSPPVLNEVVPGNEALNLSWGAVIENGVLATGYRLRWRIARIVVGEDDRGPDLIAGNGDDPGESDDTAAGPWKKGNDANADAADETDGLPIPGGNLVNIEYSINRGNGDILSNGTRYEIQAASVNPIGVGEWSESTFATPGNIGAPDAPQAFALATPAGDTQLVLSWSPPANTGNSPLRDYRLRWRDSTAPQGQWFKSGGRRTTSTTDGELVAADVTTYTIENLQTSTTYVVQIAASNIAGISDWTAAQITTPTGAGQAPTPPAFSAVPSRESLLVSWALPASSGSSAVTGYHVRWRVIDIDSGTAGLQNGEWQNAGGASDNGQSVGNVRSYTIAQLTARTNYHVQVRAVNQVGPGEWSASQSAITHDAAILNLDVDNSNFGAGNGTDGILILRYLTGLRGTLLTTGVIVSATAPEIENAIRVRTANNGLDVDADGEITLRDGILIARVYLGVTGPALIAGQVTPASDQTAAEKAQEILDAVRALR